MPKLYKCEKCLHEFSRKQHLTQHYNRKIPCLRAPPQTISCEDIHSNILPHEMTSGNMIVNKILPIGAMLEVKLKILQQHIRCEKNPIARQRADK